MTQSPNHERQAMPKFKVGDTVRAFQSTSMYLGKEGAVEAFRYKEDCDAYCYQVAGLGSGLSWPETCLELVSPSPEPAKVEECAAKVPCEWGWHDYGSQRTCVKCGWGVSEIEAMGQVENDRRRSQPSAVATGPEEHHLDGPWGGERAQPSPVKGDKPDPYAEHRIALAERIVAEGWGGGAENLEQITARYTAKRPTAAEARKRNIAALAHEMRTKKLPEHPKPGRLWELPKRDES